MDDVVKFGFMAFVDQKCESLQGCFDICHEAMATDEPLPDGHRRPVTLVKDFEGKTAADLGVMSAFMPW